MLNQRIHIITGHYGSGKSEVSVNMAITLSRQGIKVVFADLDIINPYFRSNEARSILEAEGITVMSTKYANTNIDIPALTGELSHYLHHAKDMSLVLDVGGDDAGAKVVGRYRSEIPTEEACLYFVVNCFRPETQTIEGVKQVLDEIKTASRMDINYLISNSHLLEMTTQQDIEKGMAFTREVSRQTQIPIAFHALMDKLDLKANMTFDEPVLHMHKYMGLPESMKGLAP